MVRIDCLIQTKYKPNTELYADGMRVYIDHKRQMIKKIIIIDEETTENPEEFKDIFNSCFISKNGPFYIQATTYAHEEDIEIKDMVLKIAKCYKEKKND